MRFSPQSVATLTIPAGKPYHIEWDEALPGFGVRINPTGKVWVVQYRASGRSRRETIGRVDTIPLNVARDTARKTLARVKLGSDPQAEKTEAKARARITFEAVTERYLKHARDRLKPRSFEEVERHLKKHWLPLRGLPLDKIGRSLIASRLEQIADQNGPIASNRARAALSALFAWAVATGQAEANPVTGTIRVAGEVSREHVIADEELATIWRACRDGDYGHIVQLLILTGQRRDEVGDMRWSELDLARGGWTIPRERTKNGLPHEVPLSEPALQILRSIHRREEREFVFGEGRGGFSGWSKSKARLDGRIKQAAAVVHPWRLHDLRRTTATRLSELGTPPHVVEAILNHISGHKAGVAGVYNRATYAKEKRKALNLWASHIEALVNHEIALREEGQKVALHTSNEVRPVARSSSTPLGKEIATLGNTETIPIAPAKLTLTSHTVRVRDLEPVLKNPRRKRRGRPPIKQDEVILEKMRVAMNEDETLDIKSAAARFAHEVLGNSLESTIRRLVRKFEEYQKKGREISFY